MLLSSRNTWTLYDVDLHTGGFQLAPRASRQSSFKLGPGTRFYWQHDAEWQPGGLISVFDNGSDPPKEKQSRGLLLRAQHVQPHRDAGQAVHQPDAHAARLQPGQPAEPAAGGNWLMGYGGLPNFTEYDASGHVLLDGTLGKNVQDFRTYLAPWSAHPATHAVARRPGRRAPAR